MQRVKEKKPRVLGRLLKYLFAHYKWQLLTVLVCILIASAANVSASVFLQKIIDDCITPALTNGYDSLFPRLWIMAGIMGGAFAVAVIAVHVHTQLIRKC